MTGGCSPVRFVIPKNNQGGHSYDQFRRSGRLCVCDGRGAELSEVIKSGHLSRYGREDDESFCKKVITLEKEFAAYMGMNYAVATSGGTMSLLCALAALA
jgi:dTDP-4-amino-4,6-dideoxygalactose transaminase